MDHKFENNKFKAEWQIKRLNESQKGLFQGFHIANVDRREAIIKILSIFNCFPLIDWFL